MPRFRKKPVEIEAVQWLGHNAAEVADFMGNSPAFEDSGDGEVKGSAVRLTTIHGDTAWARPGDWIIPEPQRGRFYPCAPDIFAATYDPVSDGPTDFDC